MSKLEAPLKDDYSAWRSNNVTKFFLQQLFVKRENIKEAIAEGQAEGTTLQQVIGQAQGIKDCMNYALFEFETIDEDKDNNSENDE